MDPQPDYGETSYKGSGRLIGKKTIITGADSGIGRAVCPRLRARRCRRFGGRVGAVCGRATVDIVSKQSYILRHAWW